MTNPERGDVTLSDQERRFTALWAADCAEQVLPLFEAKRPLTPAQIKRSRAPGHSQQEASEQGSCALFPWRRTRPHVKSAIPLPQPPFALPPTPRRHRACAPCRTLTT
jgi:hypothetical protein